MAFPISAARTGSLSISAISRRTHSSKAMRIVEPSGPIVSNSSFTAAITRLATLAPIAQPRR
jgi:hypothetical protein